MIPARTNPTPTASAILLGYGLAASGLSAQTTTTNEDPAAKPHSHGNFSEMIVTGESPVYYHETISGAALFADTPLIETPFSVSVYNEKLIEDQRAFTLQEVLENDPSVAVQLPGGYYAAQNFSIRGFRVDNFNGYRIDGLPIIQTAAPYIDDKSRVELLKGPAALRYGFMPPGGAINLVRKRPTQDFSTSLQFDVNTFGSTYSQLDVSDTVANGEFGYRLVLAGEEFDSFYDNADGNRLMGSLFTEWKPTDTVTIWSSVGGQNFRRNGYYGPMITQNGRILDTGIDTNIMQDWARNIQDVFDAAIGADIEISEEWKLRTSFSYQDTERDSLLTSPYAVEENGDFIESALITKGPFEWESWGAHVHIEGSFNTGNFEHNLVVGADYRTYETHGERTFPDVGPNNAYTLLPMPIPAPGRWRAIDFEYEEYGFFATDTIKFNEHWSVLLGGRYGSFENTYPTDPASNDKVNDFSPTAALMYSPVEEVHTYFTYTRGMQDGGTASAGAANAFAPLGVQESEQFELGVKTDWCDGRLSGELALFHIEQDLALRGPGNVEEFNGLQRHRGIELGLRGRLTDYWQAGVATMLLDPEQVETKIAKYEGKTPANVPDYQVNVWSVIDVPVVPGLSFSANARFVDKQYLDPGELVATHAYAVLDVGARYRFEAEDTAWTFRLNVENVLDERYYETGETYDLGTQWGGGAVAYGEPINATFSVQVEF